MAVQKTPPLGWPHTEAVRHADADTLTLLEQTQPPPPGRRGCGCRGIVVFLLVILAIVGIVAAIIIASLTQDASSAEEVFNDTHTGWEIEVSEMTSGSFGPAQLVVWSSELGIGRIVMMDPVSYDPGWEERPLIRGMTSAFEEEMLLDAFSESYGSLPWVYIEEATPAGGEGAEQPWSITYRLWDEDTGEWSGQLQTDAIRYSDTGLWYVTPAEGTPASDGSTPGKRITGNSE